MACRYCHNPDSWNRDGGQVFEVSDLVDLALRYKPYYGDTGGVTLSGGEPLLQLEFTAALLTALKTAGLSTALDTSGYLLQETPAERAAVRDILRSTELTLLDIKSSDPQKYRWLTGQSIEPLETFLSACQTSRVPLWIRQVIVPGWNDQPENIRHLGRFLAKWPDLRLLRIQLLPYHTMGESKWARIGRTYPLSGTPPMLAENLQPLQRLADELVRS